MAQPPLIVFQAFFLLAFRLAVGLPLIDERGPREVANCRRSHVVRDYFDQCHRCSPSYKDFSVRNAFDTRIRSIQDHVR